jgi:hypothetical protein
MFYRVSLDGEAESGTHSHLGEAGFTWLYWIQVILTVLGIEKTTTKGTL